jgi:hypothetical protein
MDIEIFVESHELGATAGVLRIRGSATVDASGSDPINWIADTTFDALPATKHAACVAAAVGAAATAGHTVGETDAKTLWSGITIV